MSENDVPRVFALDRSEDVSGVAGTGTIAYGIKFSPPNGKVVIGWMTTPHNSVKILDSIEAVLAIFEHGGRTRLRYLDTGEVRTR